MLEEARSEIAKAIGALAKLSPHEIATMLEEPKVAEQGDFAFPCFKLASVFKKNPHEIALDIKKKLPKLKLIKKIEVAGPYLNLFVDSEKLASKVLLEALKLKYGFSAAKKGKAIVEFVSPNTNKPLHLGHLRNAALGESVSRILEANGHKVIRACLYNDRGIHISKSMLAYDRWGNSKTPKSEKIKGDHFVGDFYVLFDKKAGENPKLADEAQELLQKWESGDRKAVELLAKMNRWAIEGFQQTFKELGIEFDKEFYETDHYKDAKKLLLDYHKKGFFAKDEKKNIIAELKDYGLPDKVVLRADGTSVYITQDIQLAKMKYDEFKPAMSIYVVADEQNLHFKQLFAILQKLGIKAGQYHHLSYGLVNLPEGRMKSREGTVVDADDLIEELRSAVKMEIETSEKRPSKDLSDKEKHELAHKIATGAINYYLLKVDPKTTMIFDPKVSISLEGDTGPYVQYAYVRANKILERESPKGKLDAKGLKLPEEISLIKHLARFPAAVEKAAAQYSPHIITTYARELADMFNSFYEKAPILNKPIAKELKTARLYLVDAVRHTLQKSLNLLGIQEVDVM